MKKIQSNISIGLLACFVSGAVSSFGADDATVARTLGKNKAGVAELNDLCSGPAEKYGREFWVSPKGLDDAPGSVAQPFKTLLGAKNAVRTLKHSKKWPDHGVCVWLLEGRYTLDQALEFGPEDSGSENSPVVYRSVLGQNATIYGNKTIPTQQWANLDEAALKRVHPKANSKEIKMLDLKKFPLLRSDKFADKNTFSSEWFIFDLFANGKRQALSQWPNPNENIRQRNELGWTTCNGSKDVSSFYFAEGGKPNDKEDINELDLDGSKRSERRANMLTSNHELWLKGFWRTPWSPWTMKVKNLNTQDCSISLEASPVGGMGSKYSPTVPGANPVWRVGNGKEGWRALNLLEEIDLKGEWALDIKDQKVYYWPKKALEGEDISVSELNQPLLKIEKSSYVFFQGLKFEGGGHNHISIQSSEHIKVAGSDSYNAGKVAIKIENSKHIEVVSNNIRHPSSVWGVDQRVWG